MQIVARQGESTCRRFRSRARSSSTSAIPVPDWTPYTAGEGARGRAERPVRAVRRHRTGRVVAVWRRDQHADAAEAGRQRADVLAVAHHGAVLADPLHASDRTQPPSERHGRDHRGRERISRRATAASRSSARRSAQILQDDGWSTFWLGKNHNVAGDRTSRPARAASNGRCRRASIASTASSAAKPTSGIPTWSKTTSSSTSRTARKRAITSPRILPTRRCK